MQHINITRIGLVWISTLTNQILNHEKISKKTGEVHCCKTILTFALGVDPVLQEFSIHLKIKSWVFLKLAAIAILKYVFTKNLDSLC